MRFAAYVATFDRPAILLETLHKLLAQTRPPEVILVVDNGTDPRTEEVARSFTREQVGYHAMGYNAGPAGAGAYALRELVAAGYDWIFCGDDDDPPFTDDTFERMLELSARVRPPVGAVGATGARWCWRTGEFLPLAPADQGIHYVDVIGGGRQLIVSRLAVLRSGAHHAELFFGQEATEFCLRIRRAGFNIGLDPALLAEYSRIIESQGPPRGLFWPPEEIWRRYYYTRNYIHFMRREFLSERLAAREAAKASGRALLSWSRGWRYGLEFTRLQLRGVVDGYRGRMGATVLPARKYADQLAVAEESSLTEKALAE